MAETLIDGQGANVESTVSEDINTGGDDTNDPATKESSEQETTAEEPPQVTPANVAENDSVMLSDVTTDKQEISVPEESALNEKSNTNMSIDEPAEESVPQASSETTQSALECKENSEIQNIECNSKDTLEEDLNKTFDSDCEIITDPVNMVDLTEDDSMAQEASQSNIEDEPKNLVDLTESSVQKDPLLQVEPVNAKENETNVDQLVELSQNESELRINGDQNKTDDIISLEVQNETPTVQSNLDVAPEILIQTTGEDVSMEESKATESSNNQQPNSEVESEKLNHEEPHDNETSKDQQVELSQNNSESSIHTADQDKSREDQPNLEVPEMPNQNIEDKSKEESNANESSNNQPNTLEAEAEKLNEEEPKENESSKDQMSVENSVVNKTNTNKSNSDVGPEMVNPDTVVDLSMEDSNDNESSNNQETVATQSEPKIELNTSTNNISDYKNAKTSNATVTIKRNQPKKCYRCQIWGHLANACPTLKQQKGAKRVGEEITETPIVAKKQKSWPSLPLDLPAFICQTQQTPKINRLVKLKMIKECQALYLNPIPKTWRHNEMTNFMIQNTRCITDKERNCFYIFVRDDDSNYTGECLVKFKSSLFCQMSWFDLRGISIDNTPLTVDLDLGHEILRQVRKDNKTKVKQLLDNQAAEEPKKNVYKFIKEKHDEMMQQKMQTDTSVASEPSGEASNVASNNNNKTDGAGPSSGPQNSHGPSSGPQNNVAPAVEESRPTLSSEIQKVRANKAMEKKHLNILLPDEKAKLLALREAEQVGRFLMPDSPKKKRRRKSSPIRVPCPLTPGTPKTPPPRIPQAWEELPAVVRNTSDLDFAEAEAGQSRIIESDVATVSDENLPVLTIPGPLVEKDPTLEGGSADTDHATCLLEGSSNDDCLSPVPNEKRAYMPKEQFGNSTYGLNEGFLKSLGLKVPLSNVLIVIGVDTELNDDRVKEIFSLAGVVKRQLRVLKKDGSRTWRVMIEYDHPVEAVQAVSMFQGRLLYERSLILKMVPPFPRPLPLGLTEIGPGLGHEGEPMRGVRSLIELQALKKMLTDFKGLFDSKIKEIEKAIADIPKTPIVREPEVPKKAPTPVSQSQSAQSQSSQSQPTTQSQATDSAAQLMNALSSLAQPNILMGLNTLLNAQGLIQPGMVQPGMVQPGMGTDPAAMAMQNQMMMQNAAYAQNFNMPPGMPPQMVPPIDQSQMVAQPYYQNQMVQPGYVPVQPVQPPAPIAPVPPVNAPKPRPPQPPYPRPAPPVPKPTPPQQTPAYTPRVPKPPGQNPGPSKSQTSNSNWNPVPVAPPAAKKQKTVEPPKPAYSSEPSYYSRPSRFDMREKPNLKVIEPVPEPQQKNDMLVFTNLPSSVSVNALNSKMREVGDVVFSEMTGRGRALVRFKYPRDAERCIKLFNRSKVDGQVINVEYF